MITVGIAVEAFHVQMLIDGVCKDFQANMGTPVAKTCLKALDQCDKQMDRLRKAAGIA